MLAGLLDVIMVVGPVATYVPQYKALQTPNDLKGFSKLTCLILLVAHMARVAYFITNPFEVPLLLQSLAMIAMQLVIVHRCVALESVDIIVDRRRDVRDHLGQFLKDLWKWDDFASYVKFLAGLAVLLALLAGFFSLIEFGGTLLGIVALGFEATLMIPQYLTNRRQRSTVGLSAATVGMLSFGDVVKIVYFWIKDTDLLFVVCAVIQLFVDFLILGQV
ncbi:MAG: PQ-loop repeat-containing protein [archaeon]|nr:PQ-loop repeat-containing protein [archaeon]